MMKNEYLELIEKNKVFADYIREHNLTDDEIKQLMEDSNTFLLRILTNKDLYDKVMKEVYDHLRNV